MEIETRELEDMLYMSFRYALGRSTYITSVCGDLLIKYKGDITTHTKQVMVKEIRKAISENRSGMAMDTYDWKIVAKELGGPNNVPFV